MLGFDGTYLIEYKSLEWMVYICTGINGIYLMDYITWSKNIYIYIWVGISFGYDWLTTNYKVNSLMCIKTDCCMLRTVVCLSWNCRWSVMSVDFKSWLLKVKLTSVLMHMCRKGMFYRVRVLLLSYKVHGKLTVWEMSVKYGKMNFVKMWNTERKYAICEIQFSKGSRRRKQFLECFWKDLFVVYGFCGSTKSIDTKRSLQCSFSFHFFHFY